MFTQSPFFIGALIISSSLSLNLCAMNIDDEFTEVQVEGKNLIADEVGMEHTYTGQETIENFLKNHFSSPKVVGTKNLFPGASSGDRSDIYRGFNGPRHEASGLSQAIALNQITPRHILITMPDLEEINTKQLLEFIEAYHKFKEGADVRNVAVLFHHLSSLRKVEEYKEQLFKLSATSYKHYENFRFVVPKQEFYKNLGLSPAQPMPRSLTVLYGNKMMAQHIQKDPRSYSGCNINNAAKLFAKYARHLWF